MLKLILVLEYDRAPPIKATFWTSDEMYYLVDSLCLSILLKPLTLFGGHNLSVITLRLYAFQDVS